MAQSLLFALVRIALGLLWLGALIVMWTGFSAGTSDPASSSDMMRFIAIVLTLISIGCALVGWVCGRVAGRRGWMAALAVAIVGTLFIPYFFGEMPRLSSAMIAAPIILPPVAFGFMTGWRRWAARRR
jgi:hypothetical protein